MTSQHWAAMPVKTGRKLPRARVDAKVAQAAVRLARHVPAAPGTAGSAKVPSTPSQVTLNLTQTPPARPSTEAQTPNTPGSPEHNAEVADLLERLAEDATPRRREEVEQHIEKLTTDVVTHEPRPPLPQSHPDVIAWRKKRAARTRLLQRQAKLTKSYRKELLAAATGGDNKWDCCDCSNQEGFILPCWDESDNGVPDLCMNSASRGAAAPARHRRASSLGEEAVGGFFFDFGAVRTESRDRDAPRRYELHKMSLPPRQRVHERQLCLSYFWERRLSVF